MDEIIHILRELDLSQKEAEVFIAMIKNGEGTASSISNIANLNRVTTYMVLNLLSKKGFCSSFIKNKIHYFKPISPKQIICLLEEKKDKVQSIIPFLEKIQNIVIEKPESSIFEGKKSIGNMLDIILLNAKKNKEILAYGNFTISNEAVKYQSLHFRKTRLKSGIKIKAIVDELKDGDFRNSKSQWKQLSKTIVNPILKDLEVFVFITSDLVGYLTISGQLTGVLIKCQKVALKEKFNFNILWDQVIN